MNQHIRSTSPTEYVKAMYGANKHLPSFNLTANLAGKSPSEFQILPSDLRYWEVQPSPQILTEKSEIPTEIPPPESPSD